MTRRALSGEERERRQQIRELWARRAAWLVLYTQPWAAGHLQPDAKCVICGLEAGSTYGACQRTAACAEEYEVRVLAATIADASVTRNLFTAGGGPTLRRVLAVLQENICGWCGEAFLPGGGTGLTDADHIIPCRFGGPNEPWNMQVLHSDCNRAKRDRLTPRALTLAAEHGLRLLTGTPAFLRRDAVPGPCPAHPVPGCLPVDQDGCACLIHVAGMRWTRWTGQQPSRKTLCGEPVWSWAGHSDLRAAESASCPRCRAKYARIMADATAAPAA